MHGGSAQGHFPIALTARQVMTNFFFEVSKGNRVGHTAVVASGHNPDIDTAAPEDVWEEGGALSYLTSAEQMNIVSTSADDASGGTGLRTMRVAGLDGSYAQVSEVVTLNGVSNVLTVNSYLRVLSMVGLTVGSGETNAGDITATAASAGTVQCRMAPAKGLGKSIHYTIPDGKTGHVVAFELGTHKLAGGASPEVEFQGLVRPAGGPWLEIFQTILDADVTEYVFIAPPTQAPIAARSDIRIQVTTDTNNTEVSCRLFIILVDDGH